MPLERRERFALFGVLFACLTLRLLHLVELSRDVLFQHPALDEARYANQARLLASGGAFEPRAFWQPPGVMVAIAAVLRVAGDSLTAPRVVTALVSTASCALVFALGRRLFGARIGLAAAAVVALHGLLIFSAAELLPATWAGMFDLLALLFLLDARTSPRHAAAAGLALGISAVFTPVVLPFAAIAGALLFAGNDDRRPFGAFAAGVALPILPVALRNFDHSGQLVLVSTNGGLNFFIGNNERYFETLAIRPGLAWDELASSPLRLAGIRDPVEQSAWFRTRGLAFWTAHPLQAFGLYLRKIWLFFHAAEIPRDGDVYAVRSSSRVLAALIGPRPLYLPDGALMPLALVGIGTSLRERARLVWPLSFLATQVLAIAMFFVSARYRVPALPVLALFAVVGAVAIAKSAPRSRARLAVATLALAVLCALPAREAKMVFAAEHDFFRALSYRKLGDTQRALEAFRRATELDPNDVRPWVELGVTLESVGRAGEAADAFTRATAVEPNNPRPRRMAAVARLRLASASVGTDRDAALRELRAAKAIDPGFFSTAVGEFETRHAAVQDAAFWAAVADLRR